MGLGGTVREGFNAEVAEGGRRGRGVFFEDGPLGVLRDGVGWDGSGGF